MMNFWVWWALDLCCWKRRQPDVVASLEDFSLWSKASVFSKATVDLQKECLQDSTSPPRYMYSQWHPGGSVIHTSHAPACVFLCFSQITRLSRKKKKTTLCADLTDVTLADEDSNSIPTDDVNGQSQAMWQCKWRHLVAKIETNASGNTWWPNL